MNPLCRFLRLIAKVYSQVTVLFENAPDLLEEFSQFLPGADGQQGAGGLFSGELFGNGVAASAVMAGPIVPTNGLGLGGLAPVEKPMKQSRSNKEKELREVRESQQMPPQLQPAPIAAPSKKRRGADKEGGKSRSKRPKTAHRDPSPNADMDQGSIDHVATGPSSSLADQAQVIFFERVKKYIDDRTTYHEFLKLLNLFVNDLIDLRTLVERAMLFLGGEDKDLAQDFKQLVGWEGSTSSMRTQSTDVIGLDPLGIAENLPMLQRPKVDLNGQRASGPSYRKLPNSEVNLACSGRDPMCWEVLNDEWVSHPTWASEDAVPSAAHKRNAYEEALHKTEEERHEYDYHIEANVRTIALLEPINTRIQQMDAPDREVFRLKSGLGGQSKSIYQRILKKIYGREQGLEVIAALHDQPAMAVPVVLQRLKQKDEEWKKAQREWNKVWREVDAKNFYKSLDHQGVVFKVNDKKAIGAKTLLAEVEALRAEHTQKQAGSTDPLGFASRERAQYKFAVEDVECLQDSLKLVFSFLDRMTAASADRDRIEALLRGFVPLFFQYNVVDFDAAFQDLNAAGGRDDDADSEDAMSEGAPSEVDDDTRSVTSRKGKKNGTSDLRTKLLRQVVAGGTDKVKGAPRGKRAGSATPSLNTAIEEDTEAASMDAIGDANGDNLEVEDEAKSGIPETTWVDVNEEARTDATSTKAPPARKFTFFANNHYFCLFRLLQVSRHLRK